MKPPLIDLCLYSEKDMSTFLEANPRLKESTRISDARGHHLLFYSDDAKERKIKNGTKELGYYRSASPAMILVVESFIQNPPCN